ncbi:MAG: chromosome segregation protein SMC [Idiomarina sp.]|nr:chromosome segregation protein SMC [Idiomarina sp.]
MRLNYIKLAGFKSFVDATKVAFPDQMTCVVGPNGCGKSNVIDAVRWVLGESSAKNLRGDAMTDVIFNGSTSRKPVSRASVELVFDNAEGRLQGEYASYKEISVKRLVTREGQSTYFLNGSKCRRRDITDIFLGTGLGPRSYAIIEQGMISRLIESRPQELRVFIEEAAGISKYKERRKETESRMRKTRENLERLTDVRDELATQLAKLQRQAAAATRYKGLKSEERLLKAQLQALRWLHYQKQCDALESALQQQQTELERWIAEQRGSERGQTSLREQQADIKQQLDNALQRFYQCNSDITRIEQSIQHQRQLTAQRRRDAQDLQQQVSQLEGEQAAEQHQQEGFAEQLDTLQPEIELLQAQQEELDAQLSLRQSEVTDHQARHQQSAADHQHKRQRIELIATQLEGVRALRQRLIQQQEDTQHRLQGLQANDAGQALYTAQVVLADLNAELRTAQQAAEAGQQHLHDRQQQVHGAQAELRETEAEQRELEGQLRAYEALITNSTEQVPEVLAAWLEDKNHQPLRELMQVAEPWQSALAVIAKPWLNAPVLLDNPERVFTAPAERGCLLAIDPSIEVPEHSLASQMRGPARHVSIFHQVALLAPGELPRQALERLSFSVGINQQGHLYYWDGWHADTADSAQVLRWQQSVEHIQQRLPELTQTLVSQQEQAAAAQQQLSQSETEYGALQQRERDLHRKQAEAQAQVTAMQRQVAEQAEQCTELEVSLEQLALQIAEQDEKAALLSEQSEQIEGALVDSENDVENAASQLSALQRDLQTTREQQQQGQQQLHQALMQKQQAQQGLAHIETNLKRNQQRIEQAHKRLAELENASADVDDELAQADLEEALERRMLAEDEKNQLTQELAKLDAELQTLNQGQQGVEQKIESQRAQVEASKLSLTASRERGNSLLEGLQDTGYALKAILENLPDDAEESSWQQRLDKIARALQQLGAINLAAIEEAQAQGERKAYLDAQFEDLTESLKLLEDAIKNIDKETRQRFRKTFEQVNRDLGELFPKVFGGGSAYLALTDDDLLETGVTIMARPPGKKNSTIHLLSGGEKALTALSLVFAIFRLNPAPFCMLDEVDAPLDDANVGRFCRLVEEMSESVQFIYISHNKIAMEMATHLAGVTMQEPGVSRLVAVDVDEAVKMAEAS